MDLSFRIGLTNQFWRFGRWVDVVIDDKLPTIDGRLIFVRSKDQNEFWPALMEKAYAKVCGSYMDMNAGTPAEAMMDFTGGVHMSIALSNPPTNLWELMCRASQTKSLMGCVTAQGVRTHLPHKTITGWILFNFSFTMMSRGKQINLVRLWNPWGTGEWNRDWSDRMSLEDLCEFYTDLDICSLNPDYLDGNSSCHWKTYMNDGRWVAGTTAGGCMNNRDSYWTNPQYRVKIGCQSLENNGEKNVLVSLMAKAGQEKQTPGIKVKDDMLSLMALRYGASSGHLTLTASSVSSSASNACTVSTGDIHSCFLNMLMKKYLEYTWLRVIQLIKMCVTQQKSLNNCLGDKPSLFRSRSPNTAAMPPPGVCLNIMEARQRQDGYGCFANPERFLNQDYQQLEQYCNIRGVRYIDDMRSIGEGILKPSDLKRVVWLRPAKIAPYPAFVLDGVSRFDIGQGLVENCWFLASIGALTFQNDILCKVVPLEQTFNGKYCGMFHFRFWRFGRWVDVVIDDKLPTIDGRLIFVRSKDQNEFWPALMEKAYAKVCGSYTDMNAGTPAEAMMDFTGGVHMSIVLSNPPTNLWELMCRASQTKSLMGCGTAQGETSANAVLPNGLVQGHAYLLRGNNKPGAFVEPLGHREWNRDWSDRSPLWQTVSSKDREMCLSVADDGEFWMSLEDLCEFYTDLDICSLSPDYLDGNSQLLDQSTVSGQDWRSKSGNNGEKNVLVSLMQKPDKRNRHLVQSLHIGLCVFEVNTVVPFAFVVKCKAQKGKFPASFFSSHAPVAQSKTYINAREVMEFLMLRPGEYLIVPSTFNANEKASFILTIMSKAEAMV
ncbi:hypothetical protein F7725_007620 [Dissostichus mawsoni]|uniref:Calpain catalytic domain-containing protein n=1 Tax=Dissostichus mawsoni TaxID=36200 RepID=A0A7J5Y748_DISMA|nr:hypothetical protein F7725_007620 [Dissostichus mawsoni]